MSYKTIRAESQYSNEDREDISNLYSEMYQPSAESGQLLSEGIGEQGGVAGGINIDLGDSDINYWDLGEGTTVVRTGPDQEGDYNFKVSGIKLDIGNEYDDEEFVTVLANSDRVDALHELVTMLSPDDDITFSFRGNYGMNKEGFKVGELAGLLTAAYEKKAMEDEQVEYDMDFEA